MTVCKILNLHLIIISLFWKECFLYFPNVKKYFWISEGPVEAIIDCNSPFDEVITTPGTVIISPNHPNNYDNNRDCQITIHFSERVRILFEAFNIESHSSCAYDYLEVRDGDSSTSDLIGSKLCGTSIPGAMESSGSTMTLILHTDYSVVRSGFKITTELGKNEFSDNWIMI